MGAYLSEPVTTKESSDETGEGLVCGASSMQGWRINQEDAHNCILKLDTDTSLFAVYDGHGGAEIAIYCSKYLPEFLKATDAYRRGDFEQALKDAFLGFDATLLKEDVIEELKLLGDRCENEEMDASDSDEDLAELKCEGGMPLAAVLEKYREGIKAKSRLDNLKEDGGSSSKPMSPFLKAKKEEEASSVATAESSSSSTSAAATTSSAKDVKLPKSDQPDSSSTTVTSSSSSAAASVDNVEGSSSTATTTATTTATSISPNTTTTLDVTNEASSTVNNQSAKTPNRVYKNGGLAEESPDSSSSAAAAAPAVVDKAVKTADADNSAASSSEAGGAASSGSAAAAPTTSAIGGVSSSSASSFNGDLSPSSSAGISSTNSSSTERLAKRRAQAIQDSMAAAPGDDTESDDDDEDDCDKTYNENNSISSTDDDDEVEAGLMEDMDTEDEDDDDDEDEEEDEEDGDEEDGEEEEDTDLEATEFINNMVEEPGKDSGCTAVVALLQGRNLYVANAGDSRCVVSRDGRALEMSFDHKPEDFEEFNRIKNAGGRVTQDGRVNGGLNLSRAIGDHAYKMNDVLPPEQQMISAMPDIKKIELTDEDDFMVLACDGIWNFMSSESVVQFIRTRLLKGEKVMSRICEELFDFCLAKDTRGDGTGCDNMTAVIIRFQRPGDGDDTGREAAVACGNQEQIISTAAGAGMKRRASSDALAADGPESSGSSTAAAAVSGTATVTGAAANDEDETAAKVKRIKTADEST